MSRIRSVFDAAVDLPTVERADFLADVEAHDPSVAAEVRALLECDTDADGLLGLVQREAETMDTLDVGSSVGAYRLQRELGRGGMGTVWLATRADEAYQAEVAIKVLSGTTEPAVRARFEAERQILATLDHPNIARLLDGGATADGTPYVVMEHVQGAPIDSYCTDNRLTIPQRLELFRQVCHAIQYAHAALVVHRDIKPSNILVDDRGVPKLLDFGIAKLLKGSLLEAAPDTRTGNHPLTPQYASPEQIRGETCATAADIYGLGVLLNVMLTGALPYRLRSNDPLELAHHVCEVEARRPSVTVLESEGERTEVETRQLSRQLEGDLDNIVLMALRKEPRHRYGSAEELAEDVRRHLQRHPVLARPATLRYRLGRFASRHRWGLATAATAVLLLLTATAFSFVQMRRAVAAGAAAEQERALAVVQALRATLAAAASRIDTGEPGAALQLLVSVSEDDRGWEWDYLRNTTSAPVTVIDLGSEVVATQLSGDGHSVVTVESDGVVRWQNAIISEVERETRLPLTDRVVRGALAAGGTRAFIAHGDGGRTVSAWDLSGDPTPRRLSGATLDGPVMALEASADGRSALAVTSDASWFVADDGSVHRWPGGPTAGLALASSGVIVAQLLGDAVNSYRVLDIRRPSDPPVAVGRDVASIVVGVDGLTVYTGEADGHVRVRDAVSGRVLDRLRGRAGPPRAVALTPDGTRLASAVPGGDIQIWDIESRSVAAVYQGPPDVRSIMFDGSGDALAAMTGDGDLWIWDSRRSALTSIAGVATRYSGDGSRIWVAAEGGELRFIDHVTGELYDETETDLREVTALAVSPDGDELAVLSAGEVIWRDGGHLHAQEPLPSAAPVIALDQATESWLLVVLDAAGSWATWNGEGREVIATGMTAGTPVTVAVSNDGSRVATASEKAVEVWDGRSGDRLLSMPATGRMPTALGFRADANLLAVGWSDTSIGLFDLVSGTKWEASPPHSLPPTAIAFSPDGRRLASGSEDGAVWISDPSTGSPIFELRAHATAVTDITFSPDGRRLLTSDRADVTRIWHGDETEALGAASERLRLRRVALGEKVAEGFSATPDPAELTRRIRTDADLSPRDRIAALQLTLHPPPPPLDMAGDPFDGFAWESGGPDSHVRVPPLEALRMTSEFTVEAWLQPFSRPTGLVDYGVVFSKEGEYQLILSDLGEIRWIVAGPDGWDDPWNRARYRTVPGEWTHVALARDGEEMSLLVNGRVVQVARVPAEVGDHHPAMDDFRIGGRQHTPTGFEGRIDEVRVWGVARSPAEVRAAMRQRVSPDAEGLIAAWSFDEGRGSVAGDLTGRHPGTLVGGAWTRTSR